MKSTVLATIMALFVGHQAMAADIVYEPAAVLGVIDAPSGDGPNLTIILEASILETLKVTISNDDMSALGADIGEIQLGAYDVAASRTAAACHTASGLRAWTEVGSSCAFAVNGAGDNDDSFNFVQSFRTKVEISGGGDVSLLLSLEPDGGLTAFAGGALSADILNQVNNDEDVFTFSGSMPVVGSTQYGNEIHVDVVKNP